MRQTQWLTLNAPDDVDSAPMNLLTLSPMADAVLALSIVACMFVLFLREVLPTEVVAVTGVAVMLVTGVLPYEAALAVLSNPAPWTIAAMFIITMG